MVQSCSCQASIRHEYLRRQERQNQRKSFYMGLLSQLRSRCLSLKINLHWSRLGETHNAELTHPSYFAMDQLSVIQERHIHAEKNVFMARSPDVDWDDPFVHLQLVDLFL